MFQYIYMKFFKESTVSDNRNSGQVIFAHITVGLQLAITMLIFVYGGHKLDLYLNKTPLFLVIGTIVGMVLGFYHLLKNLQIGNDNVSLNNKKKDENKRVKWN